MQITHKTPKTVGDLRLHYRDQYNPVKNKVGGYYEGPIFILGDPREKRGMHAVFDPKNIIAEVRLYQWFNKEAKRSPSSGFISKKVLVEHLFEDFPSVLSPRVGRILRMILPYSPHKQVNPTKTDPNSYYCWRWAHPLEIVYGLEHLMLLWVPRVAKEMGSPCETHKDFLEELAVLKDQGRDEDHALFRLLLEKNIY